MQLTLTRKYALAAVAVVVLYATASLMAAPRSFALSMFANNIQNLILLVACVAMVRRARESASSMRLFWVLLASSTGMWLLGAMSWTLYEDVFNRRMPSLYIGDALFQLHYVPLLCALALRPDLQQNRRELRVRYFDLLLLAFWSLYGYLFAVVAWQTAIYNFSIYSRN